MSQHTDFKKPYTEEELEELRNIFRSMSTFKAGGWIKATEIPKLIDAMKYPRTDEQKKAYVAHWEQNYAGMLTMDTYIDLAAVLHSTAQFSRENAVKFDRDGDGYISPTEFGELLKMLSQHDARLEGKTFEDFVNEADSDLDGKVTIQECTDWIQTYCDCDSRCGTPTPC